MSILKALEEFLSEIAQQQQGAQPAGQRGGRRPTPARQVTPAQPAAEAEVVEATPVHEGVSQHVAQHLDTSDIRRHTSQLGSQVAEEGTKLQSQLREKFDHQVGRLQGTKRASPAGGMPTSTQVTNLAGVPARASEIATLLRSPASIRQAIMLNEILTRPEHRW